MNWQIKGNKVILFFYNAYDTDVECIWLIFKQGYLKWVLQYITEENGQHQEDNFL